MTVTIVDYGLGNLFSIARAIDYCGGSAICTADPKAIDAAQRIVLPGVGAFAEGMEALRSRGLIDPLLSFARSGRPFLGICLGMQVLFEESSEFGTTQGLGLLPGRVEAIPTERADGRPRKVPHIGWNTLLWPADGAPVAGSFLDDASAEPAGYFIHSYACQPSQPEHRLAECDYEDYRFTAVARRDSLVGCQFHPEKSGAEGLRMIARFLSL